VGARHCCRRLWGLQMLLQLLQLVVVVLQQQPLALLLVMLCVPNRVCLLLMWQH